MGGNSSSARGSSDYLGVGKIGEVVVVEGTRGQHNLPFFSRDGKARIRFGPDGTFRQIFHYHKWTSDGNRGEAQWGPKKLYEEYEQHLKGVEFHEKR